MMALDSKASSRVFLRITAAVLATALLATTIFANTIPGLHVDVAWVLLRILDITNGARPFSGMNFYTGAMNEYLAWPFVVGSGYQLWGLRLACVQQRYRGPVRDAHIARSSSRRPRNMELDGGPLGHFGAVRSLFALCD